MRWKAQQYIHPSSPETPWQQVPSEVISGQQITKKKIEMLFTAHIPHHSLSYGWDVNCKILNIQILREGMQDLMPSSLFSCCNRKPGDRRLTHEHTRSLHITCKPGGPLPFWGQRQCPSSAERLWWQTWWEVALAFPPSSSFTLLYCEVGASLSRHAHSSSSLSPALLLFQLGERERGWPKGPGPCMKCLPLSMRGGSITARLASPRWGGWERGQSRYLMVFSSGCSGYYLTVPPQTPSIGSLSHTPA